MLKIYLFDDVKKLAFFMSPIIPPGKAVCIDGKVYSTTDDIVSIVEKGKFVGLEFWGCVELKEMERW